MKSFKFLSAIVFSAAIIGYCSSCNSSDEKKSTTDSTTVKSTDSPVVAVKPSDILVVMHKVKDYGKWKPIFESDDSAQLANGLTRTVVGRGIDDSNMVLIGFKMNDYEKAKAMSGAPALKDKMNKAGVTSAPSFDYVNMVMMDTNTNSSTNRVIIMHKVKDWDAWKKSFDSHKQTRMDNGLTDRGVGYSMDDNHMVTVVLVINDMAKAKAFMNSQELKDKMAESGVEGKPTVFMYRVAERY